MCSDRHFYWFNIPLLEYKIISVQTHNIRNIFFGSWSTKQLVVSIRLFLFWPRKLIAKKVCEKIVQDSTLEQVLLVFNRNVELLRLVGTAFNSKVVSFRKMRKKNLIILQIINKQTNSDLLVVGWRLSCQISIESVGKIVICSVNVLMTKRYLKFFSILL